MAYGHKTWQGSGLWWVKLTHGATQPSDHVVRSRGNEKLNICYFTKPVTTKLNSGVTYDEENSSMISHEPLTTWSSEVT